MDGTKYEIMDRELFKEIEKTNSELLQLYEFFSNSLIKKNESLSGSRFESRLHIIHDFINTSFVMVIACIDRFIKIKYPNISVGFSVNYYPQYTDGLLKGRIELDGLRSFIFKNNNLNKIFDTINKERGKI